MLEPSTTIFGVVCKSGSGIDDFSASFVLVTSASPFTTMVVLFCESTGSLVVVVAAVLAITTAVSVWSFPSAGSPDGGGGAGGSSFSFVGTSKSVVMVGNCPLVSKYLQRKICSLKDDMVYRSSTIRNPTIILLLLSEDDNDDEHDNLDKCCPITCKSP